MLSPRFTSYTYEVTVEVYHQCKRIKSAVDTHMVVVQSFLWVSGVLQCLARRLEVLLVSHSTIMNSYVDTLALLHIIWQDIKDQLAVVASSVRQPQKSTLMIVQQVSNARSDGAKLDSMNYVMYLY